ncbi:hypothetical protein Psch_02108 [Pelotomaculum schinkii]|uniref:HTH IS408-type domain-containing protein n=1 Tax=Pelotomaculum schinkii TaxID=78350 RepID=A0A4Y7RHT5_9FIRM|nr:transposase [Pelotomaculum schinkii]TEB08544.1 hypothetical protein Psch_02108 [Pelotomaculum schinkii]
MRQIARSLNISHSTVKDHLARAELAKLSWPLPEDMNDDALEELLFPSRQSRITSHQPDFAYIHKELRKKGVTLELLWTEYKREYLMAINTVGSTIYIKNGAVR